MKKQLCIALSIIIIVSCQFHVFAYETPENYEGLETEQLFQEIYERFFQKKCQILENCITENNTTSCQNDIDNLIDCTLKEMNSNGLEVYLLSDYSIHDLEHRLGTKLDKITLSPGARYFLMISGENGHAKAPGNTFSYTYKNVSYLLRYLTVTAADDPIMFKTSHTCVLNSSSPSVIGRCLDAYISVCLSNLGTVGTILGTVSSFCGVSLSDLIPNTSSTMDLYGASSWTRVYTQVWSTVDSAWLYGSSVEYANLRSHVCGYYYSNVTNAGERYEENSYSHTMYSPHFTDFTWRKEKAIVYGLLNGWPQYDTVGNATYKHDGVVRLTHYENF